MNRQTSIINRRMQRNAKMGRDRGGSGQLGSTFAKDLVEALLGETKSNRCWSQTFLQPSAKIKLLLMNLGNETEN